MANPQSDMSSERALGSNYALRAEDFPEEIRRLVLQGRILNKALGGLIAERSDAEMAKMERVLDLGCGTGSWTVEVAAAYPHLQMVGVDIGEKVLYYARELASRQDLQNVTFHQMDLLKPLEFPDESFDLINMRLLVFGLTRQTWPVVLRECHRLLRKGGVLRLTETDGPGGHTTSAAYDILFELIYESARRGGYGFAENNRSLALTAMLQPMLRQAGFVDVKSQAYALDFSNGSPYHDDLMQDAILVGKNFMPSIVKRGITSQEVGEQIFEKAVAAMESDGFYGLWYWLTAWGRKP